MSGRSNKSAAALCAVAALTLFPPAELPDPEPLEFQFDEMESVASDVELEDLRASPMTSEKRKVLAEISSNATKRSKAAQPAETVFPEGMSGVCPDCGQQFLCQPKDFRAVLLRHRDNGLCPIHPKEFPCEDCAEVFNTRGKIDYHKEKKCPGRAGAAPMDKCEAV